MSQDSHGQIQGSSSGYEQTPSVHVFNITFRNKALTLSEILSFKSLRFFPSDCWACKEKQQQNPDELIPVRLISALCAEPTSSVAQRLLEILNEEFI